MSSQQSSPWSRCTLVDLDHPDEAYFNPSQIAIDKKIPWNEHKQQFRASDRLAHSLVADPVATRGGAQ